MNNNKELAIFASPLPFSNKQIKATAVVGSTLQQIHDLVLPTRLVGSVDAMIFINGEKIFPANWKRVRPKEGTVINVRIVPGKGPTGGKNPIATLLTIAVLIAAPYAGFALAASLVGTAGITFASVGVLTSVFTATVGVVGALLVNAIAPPPKPRNLGQVSDPAESPTQFIEGASNQLNPFGVVPVCLGTNLIVPPQAAKPFVETQDNQQYVRQLFTYGYGDSVVISNLQIGTTPIEEFTDFDIEHKLNGDLHTGTTLYTNSVNEDDYNILLQQVDGFTLRTTHINVDEAVVDVTFPNGLVAFDANGSQINTTVLLQMQYAPTGTSDWSPAIDAYSPISTQTITEQPGPTTNQMVVITGTEYLIGYRTDVVVLDIYSGVASVVIGTATSLDIAGATAPTMPTNALRLSTVVVKTLSRITSATATIISATDDRDLSLVGNTFENTADFKVTFSGAVLSINTGGLSVGTAVSQLNITSAQREALRQSVRVVFPVNGTYDIRIERITADSTVTTTQDQVFLTAIKSVKYITPVNLVGINGTAIRIKGTDQLNGAIDQFNALASNVISDYNEDIAAWQPAITSNPASLYRYVLQGGAHSFPNAKPIPDDEIDIDDLEAWHTYCVLKGYEYNRIIDYVTTIDEVLRDIASAGAASPTMVDGKRTIVVDNEKDDIVQWITPRNSWQYQGIMTYPDLPHAFRCQFRNKAIGYLQDEVIIYDDGYSEFGEVTGTVAATLFEVLDLQSCTNSDGAFKIGRRQIASARLRPETHTAMMDMENLVALRGQRVKFVSDIPLIGIGQARIKTVTTAMGNVTNITVDDTIEVPDNSNYYVQVRLQNGDLLYESVVTTISDQTSFNFTVPFSTSTSPSIGDLCTFVEIGDQNDFIVTKIEPQADLSAKLTFVDYAPAIFTAETAPIPPFNSNVTTPLEFIRPVPPVLLTSQSNESVMIRNSDGSLISRAIFTFKNNNQGDVQILVQVRVSGSTVFTNANVLESTPERLILTGLEDGINYDIEVRYQRNGSNMISLPLLINSFNFVGASSLPDDITNFIVTITGQTALFKWDPSAAIDHAFYRLKFTKTFVGGTWETAQILEDQIFENRLATVFLGGTYFLKDVDILGNESENAAAVITYDPGVTQNVVATLEEDPAFAGNKVNIVMVGGKLILADTSMDGYYYFNENPFDLGAVYTSLVSGSIIANGNYWIDLFEPADLFALTDMFGMGAFDLFSSDDLFLSPDLFGVGVDSWSVQLQYSVTNDDPADSPVIWEAYTPFVAGNLQFRGIDFRLYMHSSMANITPQISALSVTIDMPDRIERGNGVNCDSVIGTIITYTPPFKEDPAVGITLQNSATDDKIVFSAKDAGGFAFKVYNQTLATYVTRTYDYITSGFGRAN